MGSRGFKMQAQHHWFELGGFYGTLLITLCHIINYVKIMDEGLGTIIY
jgi:hypothetical protein